MHDLFLPLERPKTPPYLDLSAVTLFKMVANPDYEITYRYYWIVWPGKYILQFLKSNNMIDRVSYAVGCKINYNNSSTLSGVYLYFENIEDLILFKLSYIF